MSKQDRPLGLRFTHVYLEKGPSAADSPRLRNRVGEFFFSEFQPEAESAKASLLTEIGCPLKGTWPPAQVRDFFKTASLHDFLDGLTVIAQVLSAWDQNRSGTRCSRWVAFVNRALEETGVSFELDQRGGVHPRIDTAFVSNRQSALRGLESPKYSAAREHFDEAYAALDGAAPRTGHAIREMHLALETVFKQHFSKASRIDVGEINNLLKPRVADKLKGPELEAAKLMLTSAGNFISAGHQFRHANGEPEPAPPSMDVTVWMLSQGTAFLRWLIAFVEMDAD